MKDYYPFFAGHIKTTSVSDVIMLHRKGEVKEPIKTIKGILLKDLFQSVEFNTQSPKDLNSFYFVLFATDSFKTAFSWNEIFHTKSCTNLFLLTETDGKKISEFAGRVPVIEIDDARMVHIRMEGLEKIIEKQAD